MERHGEEVHVSDTEARSGSTPHIVRYVLGISTLLVIVALSAIWITGALNAPQRGQGSATVSEVQSAPAG